MLDAKDRQLQEDHQHLVRELAAVLAIRQDYVGAEFRFHRLLVHRRPEFRESVIPHHKVEQEHAYYRLEVAIAPLGTWFALRRDHTAHVIDSAVSEKDLRAILHLDYYVLTIRGQTMDVKDACLIEDPLTLVLLVKERHVLNLILALEQLVEEVNEEVLVHHLPEDNLETDIGERVYKL